jgi:hypothetical protein
MVFLGNLSAKRIARRLEIKLTPDELKTLDDMRQDSARNLPPDKWHCFDMPFYLICGSQETADKVGAILRPYTQQMSGQITVAVSDLN